MPKNDVFWTLFDLLKGDLYFFFLSVAIIASAIIIFRNYEIIFLFNIENFSSN